MGYDDVPRLPASKNPDKALGKSWYVLDLHELGQAFGDHRAAIKTIKGVG